MKINRNFENEMIKRITIEEFVNTGALWFINQQLHLVGLAIAYDKNTSEMFPVITKFRGFNQKDNDEGYKKLSEYLNSNIEQLKNDCD